MKHETGGTIALATHRYPGTHKLAWKGQAAVDRILATGIAHKRRIPGNENGTGREMQEKSSVTGLKDTVARTASTIPEMKVFHLLGNMANLTTQLVEGTTTMFNQWRRLSVAHERASRRIRSLRLQSPCGVNILR